MPETEPRLAIVVVTHNVRADLERCLRSLTAAPPSVPWTVTVVDNASADGTLDEVGRHWPSVQGIPAGGNLGFSRANNLGIRATTGELVLLLNPDTLVETGQLDRLVARAARRAWRPPPPGRGSSMPTAAPSCPSARPSHRGASSDSAGWVGPTSAASRGPCAGSTGSPRSPAQRDWVSAACLLAWRADLEAVGLLDERYFMYTEDADLCAAFRARGRSVIFVPEATVRHLRGRSAATAPAATAQRRRESHLAYYRKHYPGWAPLLAWWLRRRGFDVR